MNEVIRTREDIKKIIQNKKGYQLENDICLHSQWKLKIPRKGKREPKMDMRNEQAYQEARALRLNYEDKLYIAARNLLDAEETYQSAYKLFKEAQKLNDTQTAIVQRWFADLNYVQQRLDKILK